MSGAKRLRPIADLARDKETRAAVSLAQCRRRHEEQERRLAELTQFRREYLERLHALGKDGIDVQRLNEYRRFNEKLTEAILQQSRLVEEGRRQIEVLNRSWSDASARRRALDKTVDRFRAEEVRSADRKEQREADDRAQHMRTTMEGDS